MVSKLVAEQDVGDLVDDTTGRLALDARPTVQMKEEPNCQQMYLARAGNQQGHEERNAQAVSQPSWQRRSHYWRKMVHLHVKANRCSLFFVRLAVLYIEPVCSFRQRDPVDLTGKRLR